MLGPMNDNINTLICFSVGDRNHHWVLPLSEEDHREFRQLHGEHFGVRGAHGEQVQRIFDRLNLTLGAGGEWESYRVETHELTRLPMNVQSVIVFSHAD